MNLQLSFKNEWFTLTEAGVKLEDYREINEYWIKRLFHFNKFPEMWGINDLIREFQYHSDELDFIRIYGKRFTVNTMTLGYPRSTDLDRIVKLEHKGIEIRTGNPEWGAEHGKLYFVIKHGKILN